MTHPIRVLLADDHKLVRAGFRAMLNTLGNVEVISGYDIARRIRKNEVFDDIVLVALTGYGMDTDIEAARGAGFDHHLTKPAEPHLINELVAARNRRQKAS